MTQALGTSACQENTGIANSSGFCTSTDTSTGHRDTTTASGARESVGEPIWASDKGMRWRKWWHGWWMDDFKYRQLLRTYSWLNATLGSLDSKDTAGLSRCDPSHIMFLMYPRKPATIIPYHSKMRFLKSLNALVSLNALMGSCFDFCDWAGSWLEMLGSRDWCFLYGIVLSPLKASGIGFRWLWNLLGPW